VCVFCFVVVAPFPSISAGLQSTFIESIDKLSVVRKGEKYRQDKCKKAISNQGSLGEDGGKW